MDQFHIVFHENILETTVFSFIVGFGLLQIIAGWRRLNGLCIYGDRVSPRVNYAIGALCLIFGYAYYFTNPEHQNTRNIEGFMSMACLAAGILAALAATLLLSSLVQILKRAARSGRHREDGQAVRAAGGEVRALEGLGLIHLPPASGGTTPGIDRLVVADREGYSRQLRGVLAGPASGRTAVLEPDYAALAVAERGPVEAGKELYALAVRELAAAEGKAPDGGLRVAGLGAGASLILAILDEAEGLPGAREAACVYPLVREGELLADALRENSLADLVGCLRRELRTGALPTWAYKAWALLFLLAAAASFAFTFAFNMRWKVLSSLIVAVAASVYLVTLYLSIKQPGLLGGWFERKMYLLARRGEEAAGRELPLPVRAVQPPGRPFSRMNRFELSIVKNRIRSDFLGDLLAVSILRGDPAGSGATILDDGRPASDGELT
jgi:hypothetical protein